MPYQPWVKVSGVWQKMTINWAEVIGGPTALADLTEDENHRTVTDVEKAAWNAAGGGSADLKPAAFYSHITAITTGTSAVTMPLTNTEVSDDNYSLSNNEITVSEAGIYFIGYHVELHCASTSGGTRVKLRAWIEADTVEINTSFAAVYSREATTGTGLGAPFICSLSAGDKLRIRIIEEADGPDLQSDRVQLSIMKLA